MSSVQEMIAVVQLYIHHRKNLEVNIYIRNSRDMFKLIKAYEIAKVWMSNNNFKMI
jgi:sulfur relay (sulfurtransferase) DsrF/TusC family protein